MPTDAQKHPDSANASQSGGEVAALLTVKQVGELLHVHPRTVWRMAAAGQIPRPITLSKKIVRWRLSEMRSFLENR